MTRAFRPLALPVWLSALLVAGACATAPPPVVAPGAICCAAAYAARDARPSVFQS